MIQMSHVGVRMQSLSMMVPVHIFNYGANVSLQGWRYKNLMVQMPSNGYVMVQMLLVGMSWCKCSLVGMSWCKCPLVGMPWCKCPLVGMPWCKCSFGYAMNVNARVGMQWMQMLWCRYNLFKNSLYFQNETSSTLETKTFSKLDLLFLKSHLLFDLRFPKNWWSLLEISEWGHWLGNLMTWLKRFIFTIWLSIRGGTFSRPFSRKMNSLKIKYLKKRFNFFNLWIW